MTFRAIGKAVVNSKSTINLQKTLVTYIKANEIGKLQQAYLWSARERSVPNDWDNLIGIAKNELDVPLPLGTADRESHVDIINRRVDQLTWCIENGYTIMATYLIDKLYRPDGSYNYTPKTLQNALGAAIRSRNVELIKNILDKGTDPNLIGQCGSPVLTCLVFNEWNDTMRRLRDNSIPVDSYNLELVRLLLDKGADPNAKFIGKSPIMLAIEARNFEMVKILLEKGVNLYDKDMDGRTVIMIAKDTEHDKIINLLKLYTTVKKMTEKQFNDCEKDDNNKVLCSISMEEIDQTQAVKPPPDNSSLCYDRANLQKWLKTHRKNPHTNTVIDDEWIKTWYPLGLDEDYNNHMSGGKRRKRIAKKTRRKKTTRIQKIRKRRTKTKRSIQRSR